MTNPNDYLRLAEDDGARVHQSPDTDRWAVEDSNGTAIVDGAMSRAEAARLYCEDRGLTPSGEILDEIVAAYRPYHVLVEFWDGFDACQPDRVLRFNPFRNEGVKRRAWDRGANAAMQYQLALAHRTSAPTAADMIRPARPVRLLSTGRR